MRVPTFVFLLSIILGCLAQDVPINLDGGLEDATADSTDFNTGGTISVNGWSVQVPKNLQVGFPATWVPWKDFVAAKGDYIGWEITVSGNVVGGKPIAGQIYISQFATEFNQGYISAINFEAGTMQITNGPTIRINDPNGVYSVGYKARPFMTADDQNPSITSFSGFPMCIPRSSSDPLCPQSNRPNIPSTGTKQGSLAAPDSLTMAPFQVGDYVEYSGFRSGSEVICYEITATNIQITTSGIPTYIRVEDALIGVFSSNANAEVADSRFIGYVSDSGSSSIGVAAIDVDVCTGKQTFRQIQSAPVDTTQTRLKFVNRFKQTSTGKYTREYRLTAGSGTKETNNKITAGQYVQPVTEWIQPELSVPGLAPIANDFSAFDHLTQGLGRDADGNIWGPLSPFPQSGVTVFDVTKCVNTPPAQSSSTVSASSSASATPTPQVDTVTVTGASWISSGGGTLTVTCTSNNTNNNAVGMVVDYTVGSSTSFNNAMSGGNPGTWTFTGRTKQPSSITCKSKLGGTKTAAVTARKKRSYQA